MSSWNQEYFKAHEVIEMIKKKEITVPQYQRGQVWKPDQENKLIDSIKNGYPFGSILLYKKNDSEYHLIDGLQRCTTLYHYLENPAHFFDEALDIDSHTIDQIVENIKISNTNDMVKNKVKSIISNWVKNNHSNLTQVENIRANLCAKELQNHFPTINATSFDIIDNLLSDMFINYKSSCKQINDTPVPAIVFKGDESLLPEVFNRINSKGTPLSKYQILAATWTTYTIKVTESNLSDIVKYVEEFFRSIEQEGFTLTNYDTNAFRKEKIVNLYQLIFGFGKILSDKYPYLFSKSTKDSDTESSGFNIINACIGNKNSKLKDLPKILNSCFSNDEEINIFLSNIIGIVNEVDKILSPYIKFKVNSRDGINKYHTEFQICSIISNAFVNRYVEFKFDDNHQIIDRKVALTTLNSSWNIFRANLRLNCFKRYFIDIINNVWAGSGDSFLDDVVMNPIYYSESIQMQDIENSLESWYSTAKNSRVESEKVANPNTQEKLFLCVLYSKRFTAADQLDGSKYDIEHLATKKLLKKKLSKFNSDQIAKLPISSIANICLLPEWDNRKKQDSTIYQDSSYLNVVKDKIHIIERKYTFTDKSMLNWVDQDFDTFDELKKEYISFIDNRFRIISKEVVTNLFDQEQNRH